MAQRMRLTDRSAAKLSVERSEYTVWDTRMAGLGVRVRPSGYRAWIYLDNRGGTSTRHTLGPVTLMTVDEARSRCHKIQSKERPDTGSTADPSPVPQFREFVEGEWKTACLNRFKPSSRKGVVSALRSQLLPEFGTMPLDRITRFDVTRWFDLYSATAPGGANAALKVFHQIMNRAIVHGHIAANPVSGVKRNPRPRLTRFLSQDEIRRLHSELDRCVAERPSRRMQAEIIRLLLLTGCRRSEIQKLQWSEVGSESLELGDSKTGPRRVFLNGAAQRIIERQPRTGSPYVFPSPSDPFRPKTGWIPLWDMVRKRCGFEDVRCHGLRHTFASQAVLNGIPLPVVAKLLGHSTVSMTLRYAHVADHEVAAAADRIGTIIAGMCGMPDA